MLSAAQNVAAQDAGVRRSGGDRATHDVRCCFCGFGKLTFVLLKFGLESGASSGRAFWQEVLTCPLSENQIVKARDADARQAHGARATRGARCCFKTAMKHRNKIKLVSNTVIQWHDATRAKHDAHFMPPAAGNTVHSGYCLLNVCGSLPTPHAL